MEQFQQDPNRMRKYHEGWVHHQTDGKKVLARHIYPRHQSYGAVQFSEFLFGSIRIS